MIIQNINNDTQVIFTPDPHADYISIARELKYTKKDGNLYKYVQKDDTAYYPKGSSKSLISIKLTAKGITTYIVKDEIGFYLDVNRFNTIPDVFSMYGDNVIIKVGDTSLHGPFNLHNDIITTDDGKSISIDSNTGNDNITIKEVSRFIHNMSINNGRMLYPIIKRFLNTTFLFKGNKHLLTGYANLSQYLYMMKQPQPNFKSTKTKSVDTDLVISFDNKSYSKLKVIDVIDSIPIIKVITNHKLLIPTSGGKLNPYVLITTKPIQMKNQKFPYSVVRYKGSSLFISPLIFNSIKVLSGMKGGINLLK